MTGRQKRGAASSTPQAKNSGALESSSASSGSGGGGMMGILDVHVHSASGLPVLCSIGEQDVYVRFRFGDLDPMSDAILQTRTVRKGGARPMFDQMLQIGVPEGKLHLRCEVFMAQPRNRDQLLGFTDIALEDLMAPAPPKGSAAKRPKKPSEFRLSSESGDEAPSGSLFLTLSFHCRGRRGMAAPAQAPPQAVDRGGPLQAPLQTVDRTAAPQAPTADGGSLPLPREGSAAGAAATPASASALASASTFASCWASAAASAGSNVRDSEAEPGSLREGTTAAAAPGCSPLLPLDQAERGSWAGARLWQGAEAPGASQDGGTIGRLGQGGAGAGVGLDSVLASALQNVRDKDSRAAPLQPAPSALRRSWASPGGALEGLARCASSNFANASVKPSAPAQEQEWPGLAEAQGSPVPLGHLGSIPWSPAPPGQAGSMMLGPLFLQPHMQLGGALENSSTTAPALALRGPSSSSSSGLQQGLSLRAPESLPGAEARHEGPLQGGGLAPGPFSLRCETGTPAPSMEPGPAAGGAQQAPDGRVQGQPGQAGASLAEQAGGSMGLQEGNLVGEARVAGALSTHGSMGAEDRRKGVEEGGEQGKAPSCSIQRLLQSGGSALLQGMEEGGEQGKSPPCPFQRLLRSGGSALRALSRRALGAQPADVHPSPEQGRPGKHGGISGGKEGMEWKGREVPSPSPFPSPSLKDLMQVDGGDHSAGHGHEMDEEPKEMVLFPSLPIVDAAPTLSPSPSLSPAPSQQDACKAPRIYAPRPIKSCMSLAHLRVCEAQAQVCAAQQAQAGPSSAFRPYCVSGQGLAPSGPSPCCKPFLGLSIGMNSLAPAPAPAAAPAPAPAPASAPYVARAWEGSLPSPVCCVGGAASGAVPCSTSRLGLSLELMLTSEPNPQPQLGAEAEAAAGPALLPGPRPKGSAVSEAQLGLAVEADGALWRRQSPAPSPSPSSSTSTSTAGRCLALGCSGPLEGLPTPLEGEGSVAGPGPKEEQACSMLGRREWGQAQGQDAEQKQGGSKAEGQEAERVALSELERSTKCMSLGARMDFGCSEPTPAVGAAVSAACVPVAGPDAAVVPARHGATASAPDCAASRTGGMAEEDKERVEEAKESAVEDPMQVDMQGEQGGTRDKGEGREGIWDNGKGQGGMKVEQEVRGEVEGQGGVHEMLFEGSKPGVEASCCIKGEGQEQQGEQDLPGWSEGLSSSTPSRGKRRWDCRESRPASQSPTPTLTPGATQAQSAFRGAKPGEAEAAGALGLLEAAGRTTGRAPGELCSESAQYNTGRASAELGTGGRPHSHHHGPAKAEQPPPGGCAGPAPSLGRSRSLSQSQTQGQGGGLRCPSLAALLQCPGEPREHGRGIVDHRVQQCSAEPAEMPRGTPVLEQGEGEMEGGGEGATPSKRTCTGERWGCRRPLFAGGPQGNGKGAGEGEGKGAGKGEGNRAALCLRGKAGNGDSSLSWGGLENVPLEVSMSDSSGQERGASTGALGEGALLRLAGLAATASAGIAAGAESKCNNPGSSQGCNTRSPSRSTRADSPASSLCPALSPAKPSAGSACGASSQCSAKPMAGSSSTTAGDGHSGTGASASSGTTRIEGLLRDSLAAATCDNQGGSQGGMSAREVALSRALASALDLNRRRKCPLAASAVSSAAPPAAPGAAAAAAAAASAAATGGTASELGVAQAQGATVVPGLGSAAVPVHGAPLLLPAQVTRRRSLSRSTTEQLNGGKNSMATEKMSSRSSLSSMGNGNSNSNSKCISSVKSASSCKSKLGVDLASLLASATAGAKSRQALLKPGQNGFLQSAAGQNGAGQNGAGQSVAVVGASLTAPRPGSWDKPASSTPLQPPTGTSDPAARAAASHAAPAVAAAHAASALEPPQPLCELLRGRIQALGHRNRPSSLTLTRGRATAPALGGLWEDGRGPACNGKPTSRWAAVPMEGMGGRQEAAMAAAAAAGEGGAGGAGAGVGVGAGAGVSVSRRGVPDAPLESLQQHAATIWRLSKALQSGHPLPLPDSVAGPRAGQGECMGQGIAVQGAAREPKAGQGECLDSGQCKAVQGAGWELGSAREERTGSTPGASLLSASSMTGLDHGLGMAAAQWQNPAGNGTTLHQSMGLVPGHQSMGLVPGKLSIGLVPGQLSEAPSSLSSGPSGLLQGPSCAAASGAVPQSPEARSGGALPSARDMDSSDGAQPSRGSEMECFFRTLVAGQQGQGLPAQTQAQAQAQAQSLRQKAGAMGVAGASLGDNSMVEELKKSVLEMEARMKEAAAAGSSEEARRQAWRQFWEELDAKRREGAKKGNMANTGVFYGCRAFF